MKKEAFVTKEQVEKIAAEYPTPFYLYDEAGIRKNAENVKKAFSWNKGFREYFAVKATPNPSLVGIMKDYGFGTDCSSMTELMTSRVFFLRLSWSSGTYYCYPWLLICPRGFCCYGFSWLCSGLDNL